MITAEQLKEEVIRLGSEYPNAVYGTGTGLCFYNQGKASDGPEAEGCIFGQAIRNLGSEFNEDGTISRCSTKFDFPKLDRSNHKLFDLFQEVQKLQDYGATWGKAIKVLTEKS